MYKILILLCHCIICKNILWNYYREVNNSANQIVASYRINSNKATTSKSFEYKTKIIGSTQADSRRLDAVVVPLKYLSNFWKSLDSPLINYLGNCVISEISRIPEVPANPNPNPSTDQVPPTSTTSATFQINNAKLCILVVTLSINDNIKLKKYIKQGFKRTISWIKYRSEIAREPKNNNLDHTTNPNLEILTDCLFFHSKMIPQETLLINITCH